MLGSLVPVQWPPIPESFCAELTREGALAQVALHVGDQVVFLCIGTAAEVAAEEFVACVHASMCHHMLLLGEACLADVTLERAFARVSALVGLHGVCKYGRVGTEPALHGFFTAPRQDPDERCHFWKRDKRGAGLKKEL